MSKKNYNTDYSLAELIKSDSCIAALRGDYIVTCPICKEKKDSETPGRDYGAERRERKLYIDPTLSCGYCFVCGTTFLDKDGLSRIQTQRKVAPLSLDRPEFICIPYTREDPKDEESHKYLIERCPQLYTELDMSSLGFYCSNEKVVILFYLNGHNYYYQLRYTNPDKTNNGIKYYMPVTGTLGKPLYFAGGTYDPFKKTILVEGVFTALVEKLLLPDCNVVAVLGHYLTEFQAKWLASLGMFNQTWIHMDEPDMSWDLKKKLPKDFARQFKVMPNFSSKYDSEEIIRMKILTVEKYREFLLDILNKDRILKLNRPRKD